MSKYGGYETLPFVAELYDWVPLYSQRPDTGFYVDACRSAKGEVLELGCGTGRVLIPAARAGCEITGLDLSEYMLEVCREKLNAEPDEVRQRVNLVRGNMTKFTLQQRFDLAIIPFRPFQHLVSVKEQMDCLESIHRHLNPRGRIILDVFQPKLSVIIDPKRVEETENVPELTLPDGRKFRRTGRVPATHTSEQVIEVELIHYVTTPNGDTERLVSLFPMRYFFRYELEHLLARCGFNVADIHGDFNKSLLTDDSPEMIFVAEKK